MRTSLFLCVLPLLVVPGVACSSTNGGTGTGASGNGSTAATTSSTGAAGGGAPTTTGNGGATGPTGTGGATSASSATSGTGGDGGVLPPGGAVIRVHYPAGSHAITVRGSAGGLSWTMGKSTAVAGDTFTYEVTGLTAAAEWKPLLDDTTWARGPNYHVAPGQTVDVWPHFTTITGKVVTLIPTFHSSNPLLPDRAIYAYLPPSYDENTDATYPVVYMHDGQNLWAALPGLAFSGTWNVDTTFDNAAEQGTCSANGEVGWGAQPLGGSPVTCTGDGDCPSNECRTFPEAIVIGVANIPTPPTQRIYEYTPTTDPGTPGGGGADAYLTMLASELKPKIDMMLRTRQDFASTAMAGSSLGGLVTAFAACQKGTAYSNVYGLVAELSPSTWWNSDVILTDVMTTLAAPNRPLIVYVDSGTGQTADDEDDTDMLAADYVALGYVDGKNFRHVIQPGAMHGEMYWAERFPGAMQLLLGVR